jgi:hypothetical protein
MTAPVTVLVAYDLKFYELLPMLFPQNPGMAKLYAGPRDGGNHGKAELHPPRGLPDHRCPGARSRCLASIRPR